MTLQLSEVFGIATRVNAASYVDRGGLDQTLGSYLGTQRHIAIHDYGVHVIVVVIWPEDHLLTYYNGDLMGG